MSTVSVSDLKAHANITINDDDTLLQNVLDAAEAYTEGFLPKKLSEFDPLPADLKLAVLMLAANWYEQRETLVVGNTITATEVPYGWSDIIRQHRAWGF
jgi:hypothetical protein